MARIHGISGSTRVLLNGIQPISGEKPATFNEISSFYDNYFAIRTEIKKIAAKQQDELIASLSARESYLVNWIAEDIARRKSERDAHILDLHRQITENKSLLKKTGYFLRYIWATIIAYQSINPSPGALQELLNTRTRKTKTNTYRLYAIEEACKEVDLGRKYLNDNYPFYLGAQGEEHVIRILSQLPDDYHVFNDVYLDFRIDARFKKIVKHVETCQIDHVVIGPTGLFLLETKNWQTLEREWKSEKLKHQVHRANHALRSYLKEHCGLVPWLQTVIVSVNSNQSGCKIDKYTEIVSPEQLCNYIKNRKTVFSCDKIDKMVRLIPQR
jgi:hypothetical protein